jgi:hypothetical protein
VLVDENAYGVARGERDYFITFLMSSIMCNDVLVLQRRKERLVGKIDMLQDILRISNKMIAFNEASAPLQVDRKIFY